MGAFAVVIIWVVKVTFSVMHYGTDIIGTFPHNRMMHQVNIKVTTFEASYYYKVSALSPGVFMIEAQSVHQFVYNCALVVTTWTQSDLLSSSNAANIA